MQENTLNILITSLAKNPMLALFALVFLVQAYMMINHLENINNTLIAIHKDNVILHAYIEEEMESSFEYVEQQKQINVKLQRIMDSLALK